MPDSLNPGPASWIENSILTIRGRRVILAFDLASLYGVTAEHLQERVKNNQALFPDKVMFLLAEKEQAKAAAIRRQLAQTELPPGPAAAFTEHGAVLLASVLDSEPALAMSLQVVRAFVNSSAVLAAHYNLADRLDQIEAKIDRRFIRRKRFYQVLAVITLLFSLFLLFSSCLLKAQFHPKPAGLTGEENRALDLRADDLRTAEFMPLPSGDGNAAEILMEAAHQYPFPPKNSSLTSMEGFRRINPRTVDEDVSVADYWRALELSQLPEVDLFRSAAKMGTYHLWGARVNFTADEYNYGSSRESVGGREPSTMKKSLQLHGLEASRPPSRPPEDGGRRQPGFRGTKAKSTDAELSPNVPCPFTTRVVVRLSGKGEHSKIKGLLQDLIFTCPFTKAVVSPLGGTEGGELALLGSPPNDKATHRFSRAAEKPKRKSGDLVVVEIVLERECEGCGKKMGRGEVVKVEDDKSLCLECADLDHSRPGRWCAA